MKIEDWIYYFLLSLHKSQLNDSFFQNNKNHILIVQVFFSFLLIDLHATVNFNSLFFLVYKCRSKSFHVFHFYITKIVVSRLIFFYSIFMKLLLWKIISKEHIIWHLKMHTCLSIWPTGMYYEFYIFLTVFRNSTT